MLRHPRPGNVLPCPVYLDRHRRPAAGSRREHIVALQEPGVFDLLHRKDDLFEDGVSTVFAILGEEAHLHAFCFDADRFTAEQAREWLSQRGLVPYRYASQSPSMKEHPDDCNSDE